MNARRLATRGAALPRSPSPPLKTSVPSHLPSSSGLGLELTRQLLHARAYDRVFATCRSPATAPAIFHLSFGEPLERRLSTSSPFFHALWM